MIVAAEDSKGFLAAQAPSSDFSLPFGHWLSQRTQVSILQIGEGLQGTLIFVEEVLFSNEVEVVSLFLHSSYLMMGEDGHRSAKLPTVPALLWLVLLAVSEKCNS